MIRTSDEKMALSRATRAKSRQRDSFSLAEITASRSYARERATHINLGETIRRRCAALKGEIKGSKNYFLPTEENKLSVSPSRYARSRASTYA